MVFDVAKNPRIVLLFDLPLPATNLLTNDIHSTYQLFRDQKSIVTFVKTKWDLSRIILKTTEQFAAFHIEAGLTESGKRLPYVLVRLTIIYSSVLGERLLYTFSNHMWIILSRILFFATIHSLYRFAAYTHMCFYDPSRQNVIPFLVHSTFTIPLQMVNYSGHDQLGQHQYCLK